MFTSLLLSAVLAAPASAAPAGDRVAAAVSLYAAKKYPQAAEAFSALAARDASDPVAQLAVCLAQLHLGRQPKAAAALSAYAAGARLQPDLSGGGSMAELKILTVPFILFGVEPERPEMLKGLAQSMGKASPSDALGWELLGYYGMRTGDRASLDAAAAGLKAAAPNSALESFFAGYSAAMARDNASARESFAAAVLREPTFSAAREAYAQFADMPDADGVQPLARVRARMFAALVVAAAIFAAFRLRDRFARAA